MDKEDKIMVIWWAVTGVLMVGWFIGVLYGMVVILKELSYSL